MATRVYQGTFFYSGQQVRGVMAGTQKQIAQAIGATVHYVAEYWGKTGNAAQIKAATDRPGVLLWCPLNLYSAKPEDYQAVEQPS